MFVLELISLSIIPFMNRYSFLSNQIIIVPFSIFAETKIRDQNPVPLMLIKWLSIKLEDAKIDWE